MSLEARALVRERVLCCESCPLHKVGGGPVPFSGPTPAEVAIVGEAPGKEEDEGLTLGIGQSGQLLRQILTGAGFVVEDLFIANSVSCLPRRTPNMTEINACFGNLMAQLELAGPRWILLVGGVALSAFRYDLSITKARGRVLVGNGCGVLEPPFYYPVYHPAYALRNGKAEKQLTLDLERFHAMVTGDWMELALTDCVTCGIDVEQSPDRWLRFDDWAAPYCNVCWELRK